MGYIYVPKTRMIQVDKENYILANEDDVQFEAMKNYIRKKKKQKIERVIFNDPATIVFWKDGTKTIVKANNEKFDKEKGLAMAICKKYFGNNGYYYDVFKEFIDE
jgi:Zn/Cd-binding protein ZinT